MLFFLVSRIISSTGAFLYPGYASYKALSKRPASEIELERWLMYWSVLAIIISIEYVAEWAISWFPFYYTLKTVFLLYLALPQTQGSTLIYKSHLAPALSTYEPQIDAALARLKAQIYQYLQEKFKLAWDLVSTSVVSPAANAPASGTTNPPTLADPVSGPIQMAWGLWRTYAPIVIAQGSAFIAARQAQAQIRQEEPEESVQNVIPPSPAGSSGSQPAPRDTNSLLRRRRQLEAELAALPRTPSQEIGALHSTALGSSSYLGGEGRYEEIARDELDESADEARDELGTPAGRLSWWGWGTPKGYEKLKDQ